MRDLYEILGVERGADADEIKKAYRRKARELHPDAGGDEDGFKEVQHAYSVLSDPQKRARYDRFGDDGTGTAGAGGDPFGFGRGGFGGLSDVIDAFFGGGGGGGFGAPGGRRQPQSGRDVLVHVALELEDVASGTTRKVEVEVDTTCDVCGGSGSASGASATSCRTCGGSGSVQRVVRTAFGQLATATTCPNCQGTGTTVQDPCPSCAGEGRRRQQRNVTVEIPPGVDEGDRLRVSGAGEAGRLGAAAGDLYVEIHLEPHELFQRDGRDLLGVVGVPFTQAVLGTTLTVPTVDGEDVEVEVPAGTQPGDVVSVRRAGLPRRGGGSRGDLRLQVQVEVPRDLDEEQRELLRRFAELRGEDVPPDGRSLFSRLREAFR